MREEHEEKEDAEHEAVQMDELLPREQVRVLDDEADGDKHEDWEDGTYGDDEIAKQREIPLS